MTRRGRGEGSVRQRPDGLWEARVSISGHRLSAYGRTRALARAGLTEARAAVEAGLSAPSSRLTVELYLGGWLERAKPRLRPGTWRGYETHVRRHIVPALGAIPLGRLSPTDVERMLTKLDAAGLSAQTAVHVRTTLRKALHDAERVGLIGRNVAALASPPRVERREIHPLTEAQVRAFLESVRGDRLSAFYTLAVASGARSGELRGLTWNDFDPEARTITIRRTIQRVDGAYSFMPPKTSRSNRTVPLPSVAIETLRLWRLEQLRERVAAGPTWRGADWPGLMFTSPLGWPLDASEAVRRFQSRLADAGLPRQRLHDTRHLAASLWLMDGVPLRTVSELLGHSGITVTADVYAHLTDESKRIAADVMESILAAR